MDILVYILCVYRPISIHVESSWKAKAVLRSKPIGAILLCEKSFAMNDVPKTSFKHVDKENIFHIMRNSRPQRGFIPTR